MVSDPHGGELVDRTVEGPDELPGDLVAIEDGDAAPADGAPAIPLSRNEYMDLELIAEGAYSPLEGFMTGDDVDSVLDEMRLGDGTPWSIPIVLAVDERPGEERHVLTRDGDAVGTIDVEEAWRPDVDRWVEAAFDTADDDHPGVRRVRDKPDWLVGGTVHLAEHQPAEAFERALTPRETRALFRERDWRTIAGFQTRNPPHRAHEYLQKAALETLDGLLIHPLVGTTKPSDVDPDVRMDAYDALIDEYHVADRVALSTLRAPMRYAGPREALLHAVVRQNYGCTHFVIGRDHAGVKDYYGSYAAHDLMRRFESEIDVQPLYFDFAFYCHGCDGMATKKTCSHDADVKEEPSGTFIRRQARDGGEISDKIMRPEVWQVVSDALREENAGREAEAEARTGGAS